MEAEGRRHHLHFLNALWGVCGAHRKRGRATLPFPKEVVALKVKEIMMDNFFSIEPKFLLAMRAVGELSKFQPSISRDLQTSMVPWALGLVLVGAQQATEMLETRNSRLHWGSGSEAQSWQEFYGSS
ncbi:UNVERIFIED_CONTAM: hypothetical protein K2H54_074691 [Gekko kuhli]